MRILCLHGVGSSGSICESQFGPFLKAIDPSYELIFVDGPVPSRRGPGMGPELEGPFFSHTTGYLPHEMADALEHLEATIEQLGPFDGILGFSQGAALAISYIHQKQLCSETDPFKFALCFSSVIPCSADAECCDSVIQRLRTHGRDISTNDAFMADDERLYSDLLLRTVIPARKNDALLPEFDMNVYTNSDAADAPRVMHPKLLKEKIRVPTIHVTGKRDYDFMRNMSSTAYELCNEKMAKKLDHSGGHQPPQKEAEAKASARAMEWAVSQSEKVAITRL